MLTAAAGSEKPIENARKWLSSGWHQQGGLKAIRLALGMSQAQLASASGMLQPHISDIENGKRRPEYNNAFEIATALNLTVPEFYDAFDKSKGEK